MINNKHRDILGLQFSIHKEDLLSINGFDERFLWPGVGEDLDVYRRLILIGKSTKSVASSALVYHCIIKKLKFHKKLGIYRK